MTSDLDRREFFHQIAGALLSAAAVAGVGLAAGRGTAGQRADCIRPPGALDEEEFLAKCIRCGRCADACPNRCITAFTEASGREHSARPGPGQRNTPVIFPRRQACVLCQGAPGDMLLCTAACPSGALKPTRKDEASVRSSVKMGTAVVDTTLCYSFNGASCGTCVRACPLEGTALRAGLWEKPLVDPDACIGCGLCERACIHYPQAIRVRPANA